MSKIAFNVLGLKSNTGGVESHIYNVVKHVLEQDSKTQYFLYVGKNVAKVFEDLNRFNNLKIIVFPINTNNSTIRVITENTFLALSLLLHKINLVHHLCNYMPRFSPIKSMTTLHDLSGFFYHENFRPTKQMERFYKYLKSEMGYTFKHAQKIIVISEFTRSEVHKYYKNVDNNKLVTIGMSSDTRKQKYKINKTIFNKYQIKQPYLLSVSVVRPHKNYGFLVRAYNRLKEKYNIPHQLIIAGGIQVYDEDFFNELNKSPYKNEIKYLGYIPNSDLATLYSFAELYVTSTIYEGFGMPLLEAMEYNLPIVCTNTASLPEVAKEGAIYFKLGDIEDATDKINFVISNHDIQKNMLDVQKERLEFYSWHNVAEKIINTYKELLKD